MTAWQTAAAGTRHHTAQAGPGWRPTRTSPVRRARSRRRGWTAARRTSQRQTLQNCRPGYYETDSDTAAGQETVETAESEEPGEPDEADSSDAPPDGDARKWDRDHGWCVHVAARRRALVLEDVRDYARFAGNPVVDEIGIHAYMGAPLIDSTGTVLGTVCVTDTEPQQWGREGLGLIKSMAADLVKRIESGAGTAASADGPADVDPPAGTAGTEPPAGTEQPEASAP